MHGWLQLSSGFSHMTACWGAKHGTCLSVVKKWKGCVVPPWKDYFLAWKDYFLAWFQRGSSVVPRPPKITSEGGCFFGNFCVLSTRCVKCCWNGKVSISACANCWIGILQSLFWHRGQGSIRWCRWSGKGCQVLSQRNRSQQHWLQPSFDQLEPRI